MPDTLQISQVRFQPAKESEQDRGHLGWATFVVGGSLKLSSVSVRRTADGRLALSFPVRRARTGLQHSIIAPVSDEARRRIEREVIAALRQEGVL